MTLDSTTGFLVFFVMWVALLVLVALLITGVCFAVYAVIDHFRRRAIRRAR